jgi:hypothetical protein
MNQYDEIKMLLKKSRLLQEQLGPINMAKSIEDNIEQDEDQETEVDVDKVKKDKSKTYRISGGLLTLHGKDKKELELTNDEKQSYQETMEEFVNEVSDLSDFGVLNVYSNSVQWSGKIVDADVEFFYSIGENNGVYINGDMIKLDERLTELVGKLTTYYEKFKTKWAKVVSNRRKTQFKKEDTE